MNTFLYEQLPAEVGGSGSQVSLSTILTDAFGPNWGGYTQFWLAYYGASALSAWDFNYWNPSAPTVSQWLNGGTAIKAATTSTFNQANLTASQVSNYSLKLGNDIAPYVFLTVPIGSYEYIQYEINVVAPGLQAAPSGVGGEPTPADIVASAERYAAAYGDVLNDNDCGFIASDLAAAAGAPLDDSESESLDPTQNNSAGFWRVVYRGSDPNPVSNWQTLLQPGDIVRMGWIGGGQHTTTVLSVNSDGSITVFDNNDSNGGPSFIGIHTVNYDTQTIPSTITIFRLTTDHLYLIDGSGGGQILNGTPLYDNQIITSGETQTVNCGPLDDVVDITAASTGTMTINGGGGQDTVVFTSLGVENVQITGSNGQSLSIVNGTIYNLSGGGVTVSWSGGSDTLDNISSIQFTDASFKISTVGVTTADMIMREGANGDYEIYSIGNNAILTAAPLGQVGLEWQVAGVGAFNAPDTSDMILRNSNTGQFEIYDISNNTLTGAAAMGQVGLEWTVSGFGDFSSNANETDMLMRDSNTGQFEIYDLANNGITFAAPMGQVGLEWSVAGFGDFSTRPNETDMLMRNSNTGAFELYDISNNQITSAGPMGQVGLEWSVAGFGDFSGNVNETDMLMRNRNTGAFEIYDISNNAITSAAPMGQVGLEWSVVGFGPINGAGSSDMLMRNNNTGAFEAYDIVNNQITSAGPMGQMGLEWQVAGIAADPPGSAGAANSQLVQAMASHGSSGGALDTASWFSQPIVQPTPAAALTLPNNQNLPAG
jgi:hypothetical protein